MTMILRQGHRAVGNDNCIVSFHSVLTCISAGIVLLLCIIYLCSRSAADHEKQHKSRLIISDDCRQLFKTLQDNNIKFLRLYQF